MSTFLLLLAAGPWQIQFEQGRAHYAAGHYEAALAAFEHSYQLEPMPTMWVNIAQCLRALGRTDEAADAFRRFLDSRWGSARVRAEVWEALDELAPRPQAESMAADERAIAHFQRGRHLYERGHYEAALGEFRAAYLITPVPAMIVNIGQCLRKLDRLPEAAIAYQTFLGQPRGSREVRAEVWEALDEVLRELDGRMFRLAESSVLMLRFLREGEATPEFRARVARVRGEVLTGLLRIDELMARPIDVRALGSDEPVIETAREEPRPLLRIHGRPRRHAKTLAQKRGRR